jgi:hypothetical protein
MNSIKSPSRYIYRNVLRNKFIKFLLTEVNFDKLWRV